MSFFSHLDFSKKKTVLVIFFPFLLPLLFFALPQKSYAAGIPVVDIIGNVQHVINTAENSVTSGATTASASFNGALVAKEFVGDGVANFIAKLIIKQLTAQTVNWINSGFKGNPSFVANPEQFFLSIGDNAASHYLSNSAWAVKNLCSPFSAKVRIALAKNYLNTTNPSSSCSLGAIEKNFDNFTNDFSQGGWDTFFQVTQNSANNPIGSYQMAQDQLSLQIGTQQNHYSTQLNQGKGFLSYQKCTSYTNAGVGANNTGFVGPVLPGAGSSDCTAEGVLNGTCKIDTSDETTANNNAYSETVGDITLVPGGGSLRCASTETVTPGSVISDQLNQSLGATWGSLVSSDEINEVVSALLTQLITHVVGGIGDGLKGVSQPAAGSPSFIQQVADSANQNSTESTQLYNSIQAGGQGVVSNATAATAAALGSIPTASQATSIVQNQINSTGGTTVGTGGSITGSGVVSNDNLLQQCISSTLLNESFSASGFQIGQDIDAACSASRACSISASCGQTLQQCVDNVVTNDSSASIQQLSTDILAQCGNQ